MIQATPLSALLSVYHFLLLLLAFGDLVGCQNLRAGRKLMLRAWILFLAVFATAYLWLFRGELPASPLDSGDPVYGAVYLLLLTGLTAACGALAGGIARYRRTHISRESIRESLDKIPTGVLIYWPEGAVKLTNSRMQELSLELTGASLLDGKGFWEQIQESSKCLPGMDQPTFLLADGSVVSFTRCDRWFEGHRLIELTASDVTQEYRMTRELEDLDRRAREINARLRALSGEIKYTVIQRENLELRAQVHDRIGHALLHTRRCFADPAHNDAEEVRKEWGRIVRLLRREGEDRGRVVLDALTEQADALGLTLTIDGAFPRGDHETLRILEEAGSVHLANVMRHAAGTHAYLEIREVGDELEIKLTNDGIPPRVGIREAGGLGNLRSMVEQAGGSMEVAADPEFSLCIRLPKAAERDGDEGGKAVTGGDSDKRGEATAIEEAQDDGAI